MTVVPSSSSSSIRESVSQARKAVIEAERVVQEAQDNKLLAVTSFDIAMRHQMDAAIDLIKRNGKESFTDETVIEVVAHYLSKGYPNGSEQNDYNNQRLIINAFTEAVNDSHPWISLQVHRGVFIEVTLPLDGDYAKAMPAFLGEFFVALDQYVMNSEIDPDCRPVILFKDGNVFPVFPVSIRASRAGGLFSINPPLLELETPIGARTFEEVAALLPILARKNEEGYKKRQKKKSRWSGIPLLG